MKYILPLFSLLLLLKMSVAQSPMRFLNGERHLLPTVIKKVSSSYIVKDTFVFLNTGSDPLKINKIDAPKNVSFTFTSVTAPNKKGYIYFEEKLPIYGEDFSYKDYNFNIQTNYGPFTSFHLAFMTISEANSIIDYENENEVKIIQKTDANWELYDTYYGNKKGKPLAYGQCLKGSNQRVGAWKLWNEAGTMKDTIYSHLITIIPTHPQNVSFDKMDLLVKSKGAWSTPLFIRKNNGFDVFVDKSMDSLKVFTDSMYQYMNLTYHSLWNHPQFALPLQKKNSHYFLLNRVPTLVNYLPDTYFLVWNLEHPDIFPIQELVPESRFFHDLQTRFPEVTFTFYPHCNQGCKMVIPKEKQTAVLTQLQNDARINAISKMFTLSQSQDTFFHNRDFLMTFVYPSTPSDRNIIQETHFNIDNHFGLEDYFISYGSKLLDENFLQDCNALSASKAIQKCHFGMINPDQNPNVMEAGE